MPAITTKPVLTLTEADSDVTATVKYTITYTPIEKFLEENGLVFKQGIELLADDRDEPPHYMFDNWAKTPDGKLLSSFPVHILEIPDNGSLASVEEHSITVTRQALNEDGPRWWYYWAGADEIHARVYVVHHGLPFPTLREDSNEVTLAGPWN